jgi:hypothetical protein
VAGTLAVAGEMATQGRLVCSDVVPAAEVEARTPCNCDPAALLDVAAEVAAHSSAPPLGLASGQGQQELTLAAGSYFDADGSAWRGHSKIVIDGAVRIFIDGDIDLHGSTVVELKEGAQLDLYIAGSVRKYGRLLVGDMEAASRAVRIYIGGNEPVSVELVGNSRFAGAIYAPQADIDFLGNFQVDGALFAKSIVGRGHLLVRYDAGLVGKGEGCDEGDGSDTGTSTGGGEETGDGTGTCSESTPEFCPDGIYPPADGSSSGTGAGAGSGAGSGTGSGSGSGTGSGDGSGGAGSDTGSEDPGVTTGDDAGDGSTGDDGSGSSTGEEGSDPATGGEVLGDSICSEENPAACG